MREKIRQWLVREEALSLGRDTQLEVQNPSRPEKRSRPLSGRRTPRADQSRARLAQLAKDVGKGFHNLESRVLR